MAVFYKYEYMEITKNIHPWHVASRIYALWLSNPLERQEWGGGSGSSQSWQCQDFESFVTAIFP